MKEPISPEKIHQASFEIIIYSKFPYKMLINYAVGALHTPNINTCVRFGNAESGGELIRGLLFGFTKAQS